MAGHGWSDDVLVLFNQESQAVRLSQGHVSIHAEVVSESSVLVAQVSARRGQKEEEEDEEEEGEGRRGGRRKKRRRKRGMKKREGREGKQEEEEDDFDFSINIYIY